MRIREMMDENVQTVSWVTDAEQAWKTLLLYNLSGLAVVKDGAVVGMVSLKDLGDASDAPKRQGKLLDQFLVPVATVTNPKISVRKANSLMRRFHVDRLAIMKGQKVVGMFNAPWVDEADNLAAIESGRKRRNEEERVAIRNKSMD